MPEMRDRITRYVRVERCEELPPAHELAVDVAVLDMNHGWPNLGHDSLVQALLEEGAEQAELRRRTGLTVRVLSFDVRGRGLVPEPPGPSGNRFAVYAGTGGPGHIDPRRNDGVSPGSQGIREDPRWEGPLFRLFDAILADEEAALVAVCHTFGVMCRWSGIARPVLRGPSKGGKSSGVLENVFTAEAVRHPWFGRFAASSGAPEGAAPGREGRIRVLDNRLFDLVPCSPLPAWVTPIGYETLGIGGPRGEALTMAEFARDAAGVMPRVFAVNHHPEIRDRARQIRILRAKVLRGEVSESWAAERMAILTQKLDRGGHPAHPAHPPDTASGTGDRPEAPSPDSRTDHQATGPGLESGAGSAASDRLLERTTWCTLLGPLRFHLGRQLDRRAASLGVAGLARQDLAAGCVC